MRSPMTFDDTRPHADDDSRARRHSHRSERPAPFQTEDGNSAQRRDIHAGARHRRAREASRENGAHSLDGSETAGGRLRCSYLPRPKHSLPAAGLGH